jgi:hypothetical protein
MKNLKFLVITLLSGVTLLSCKNENQTNAEKVVADYENYVDSINNITVTEMESRWDYIENDYQLRKLATENALVAIEDREDLQEKIILSNEKYDLYRTNYLEHQEKNQKPLLRTTLFGSNDIGNDTTFPWVNKDNILSVFDKFTSTVTENKDAYSREDWDEIKMLYEALGTRKNTVEKEGLSSSDNMKIASIKVKFAPMLAINRAGEKSKENAEAKE